jgi:protein SCO1/2
MARKLSWLFGIALISGFLFMIFIGSAYRMGTGKEWQLMDIAGHLPYLRFSLVADRGQLVTEKDYRGDVVLLYFGFTKCEDECPITMLRLSRIMQRLGQDAEHVRLLFITVDPENDTPQVLHQYIAAFDPEHMAGLTGGSRDLEAIVKRYRAANRPEHGKADDISHSNVMYIFDQLGQARLLVMPDDSDEKILNDVRRMIHDAS